MMEPYTNIHRVEALAWGHPLVCAVAGHKTSKALDDNLKDDLGRATGGHQSPWDLKLALAASGAHMYVGVSVHGVARKAEHCPWAHGLLSCHWSLCGAATTPHDLDVAKVVFQDIFELKHDWPPGWQPPPQRPAQAWGSPAKAKPPARVSLRRAPLRSPVPPPLRPRQRRQRPQQRRAAGSRPNRPCPLGAPRARARLEGRVERWGDRLRQAGASEMSQASSLSSSAGTKMRLPPASPARRDPAPVSPPRSPPFPRSGRAPARGLPARCPGAEPQPLARSTFGNRGSRRGGSTPCQRRSGRSWATSRA